MSGTKTAERFVEEHDLHGTGAESCEVYVLPSKHRYDLHRSVTDVPCPVEGCDQTVTWREADEPSYRVCAQPVGNGFYERYYHEDSFRHRFVAQGSARRPVLVRDRDREDEDDLWTFEEGDGDGDLTEVEAWIEADEWDEWGEGEVDEDDVLWEEE